MQISEMVLSTRTARCLHEAGITTTDQLLEYSENTLLTSIPSFGKKSLNELREALRENGIEPVFGWRVLRPHVLAGDLASFQAELGSLRDRVSELETLLVRLLAKQHNPLDEAGPAVAE